MPTMVAQKYMKERQTLENTAAYEMGSQAAYELLNVDEEATMMYYVEV